MSDTVAAVVPDNSAGAAAARIYHVEGQAVIIGDNARQQISYYGDIIVRIDSLEELPPKPGEPPYKGLAYYTEADAGIFFGREQLSDDLAARLETTPFLAVAGASGSGKSSLLRAGVIPRLRRKKWLIHILTPTADPLTQLANSLTHDDPALSAADDLRVQLAADPQTLRRAAEKRVARTGAARLLLIVDQFEELFTQCHDEAGRRAFIDNLLAAARVGGNVTVLIGLRADFTGRLTEVEALRTLVEQNFALLGPMQQADLVRVIAEPARIGGWAFVSGLVEQFLSDVGQEPGRLPLLSHALLETWARRAGHVMTLRGYREAGGVEGAIAKTAEDTLRRLDERDEQPIMQAIFLALTELGEGSEDTRRIARRDELERAGDPAAVEAVLNTLAAARLVMIDGEKVEVAHEALIRRWPRLRGWLADNRERVRFERQLEADAQAWLMYNRDVEALYGGARLAAAQEWRKDGHRLSLLVEEFLDRSALEATEEAKKAKQLERAGLVRRFAYVAGALAVIALIAAGAAAWFGYQQNQTAGELSLANATSTRGYATAIAAQGTSEFNEALAQSEAGRALQAEATATRGFATAVAAQATSNFNAQLAVTSESIAIAARSTSDANSSLAINLAQTRLAKSNDLALAVVGVDDILATQEAEFITNEAFNMEIDDIKRARNSLIPIFAQNLQIGMNVNPDAHIIDGTALEGLDWVRLIVRVDSVSDQAIRGDIEAAVSRYEPVVGALALRGISVLFVLNHETFWGEAPWDGSGDWEDYANDMAVRAAQLAGEMSQRYAKYGGLIAYEIWNEPDASPDNPSAISIPAEAYAMILERTSTAIRSASPNARVLFASLGGAPTNGVEYIRRVQAELGGELPVDAISMNPYGRYGTYDPFWNGLIGTLDEAFDPYLEAFPDLPIWVTEIGIGNDNPIDPEYYDEIANYMRDVYLYIGTHYSRKVPVVMWFAWSDLMQNAGVVDRGGQPKEHIYDTFLDVRNGTVFQELSK